MTQLLRGGHQLLSSVGAMTEQLEGPTLGAMDQRLRGLLMATGCLAAGALLARLHRRSFRDRALRCNLCDAAGAQEQAPRLGPPSGGSASGGGGGGAPRSSDAWSGGLAAARASHTLVALAPAPAPTLTAPVLAAVAAKVSGQPPVLAQALPPVLAPAPSLVLAPAPAFSQMPVPMLAPTHEHAPTLAAPLASAASATRVMASKPRGAGLLAPPILDAETMSTGATDFRAMGASAAGASAAGAIATAALQVAVVASLQLSWPGDEVEQEGGDSPGGGRTALPGSGRRLSAGTMVRSLDPERQDFLYFCFRGDGSDGESSLCTSSPPGSPETRRSDGGAVEQLEFSIFGADSDDEGDGGLEALYGFDLDRMAQQLRADADADELLWAGAGGRPVAPVEGRMAVRCASDGHSSTALGLREHGV